VFLATTAVRRAIAIFVMSYDRYSRVGGTFARQGSLTICVNWEVRMRDNGEIMTTPRLTSATRAFPYPTSAEQSYGETPRPSWLDRILHRRKTSTVYQRCLAVHIHSAEPRSALS
jgi:hypothetical protein